MQLDGLLKSLKINSINFFDKTSIIYTTSSYLHKKSYEKLIEKYKYQVQFFRQNFIHSFSKLLRYAFDENFDYVVFMTDDDLLFDKINSNNKKNILNMLYNNQELSTFSLRLGINCNYSHPANLLFQLKNYIDIGSDYIIWNWKEQQKGDFSYPLSVDGHIFRRDLLSPIIYSFKGPNPNILESFMQHFLDRTPSLMSSFKYSKLVGVPVNLVSNSSANYYGKKFFYDQTELAKKYLEGYVLDISRMDFSRINSAHQEIEFQFTKEV